VVQTEVGEEIDEPKREGSSGVPDHFTPRWSA